MGYYPRLSMIEENLDLLEDIFKVSTSGKALTIQSTPEELGTTHYNLNRLMAATSAFSKQYPRYSGLRKLVRFKINHELARITVTPTKIRYAEVARTLEDAIADLQSSRASTEMLEFYPTHDFKESEIKALASRLEQMGWELVPTPIVGEDGSLTFGALRIEPDERRGFDALAINENP